MPWRGRKAAGKGSSLEELWRATVPGLDAQELATDAASSTVVIADGWGVSYAALRLHRFDLATGNRTASVRTRSQPVGAICFGDGEMFVATSRRLFRLRSSDMSVVEEWERVLVANTQRLVRWQGARDRRQLARSNGSRFRSHRVDDASVKFGSQPVFFVHEDELKVIAGSDGGMSTLDHRTLALVNREQTPPVNDAVSVDGIWCVLGGRLHGGDGQPPVWIRGDDDRLMRLTGTPVHARLSGRCVAITSDRASHSVWCIVGDGGTFLERVDRRTGMPTHTFSASGVASFRHVDADARVAIAIAPGGGPEAVPESVVISYRLPSAFD